MCSILTSQSHFMKIDRTRGSACEFLTNFVSSPGRFTVKISLVISFYMDPTAALSINVFNIELEWW